MGQLHIHEFISLDGVIDAPTWTFEYGFDPRMGERLAALTGSSRGILLGRRTYQMFEGPWSSRTAEEDPGAPFFNDTTKYVVSGTLAETTWRNSTIVGRYDPATITELKGRSTAICTQRQRNAGACPACGRLGGSAAPLRLPTDPRIRSAAVRRGQPPSTWRTVVAESYDNGVVYVNLQRGDAVAAVRREETGPASCRRR